MTTYNIFKTSENTFGCITEQPCKNAKLNPIIQAIFDKHIKTIESAKLEQV